MEPIRLYTQKLNPYAEKVARALNYKGLPYERHVSDAPADIKRWSPVTGQLPVLEMGHERRAESSSILRWLEEHFPEPSLLSRDPVTAAQQQGLEEWSDTSFVWYWNRWRAARFPLPGDEKPVDRSLLSKLRGGIERAFGRPDHVPSRAELRELEISNELSNRLDELVGWLGQRPFFHSDALSVADLSVFGMLQVMRDSPMMASGAQLLERPQLIEYIARVEVLTSPKADAEDDEEEGAEGA